MLKFDVGEFYISSNSELLFCSNSETFVSEFHLMNENKKILVTRNDYGTIHDLITKGQFKDMVFVFDSSCYFKRPFYNKIVDLGGGKTQTTLSSAVTCFISNANGKSTQLSSSAKRKKIKKLQESEFWRLYYKE